MKKLLAISSSPRKGGNSEILLQNFLEGAEIGGWCSGIVRINDLSIRLCQACDLCASTGKCILQDDMTLLYDKIAAADGLVLATPVFFGSMSGQLKIFIDRFQCWWHAKYNLKKPRVSRDEGRPGFFICVGAMQKKEHCASALEIAGIFYHNINFRLTGHLSLQGFDAMGAIATRRDLREQARLAGLNFNND